MRGMTKWAAKWAVCVMVLGGAVTGCKKADPAPAPKPAVPVPPAPVAPAAPEGEAKAPEGEAKAPEGAAKAPEGAAKAPEGEFKAPVEKAPEALAGEAKLPEAVPAAAEATGSAADCEKAVDHMFTLLEKATDIPAEAKAQALEKGKTPEGRKQAVEGCMRAPAAITACMLGAADLRGAMTCQMAGRPIPPQPNPGDPAAPGGEPAVVGVPAADEGDCGKAFDHMIALLQGDTTVPAETKQGMLQMIRSPEGRKQAVESCKKEPPETIACVLAAKDFESAGACGRKAPPADPGTVVAPPPEPAPIVAPPPAG